jgi:adenylyltransferase/sulfurtransferase
VTSHEERPLAETTRDSDEQDTPEITVGELKTSLDAEERLVLVDVREPFERRIADLPETGQLRIPVGEIESRLGEIDPGERIVLYCRTGSRSGWATRLLRDRGFDEVFNLKGGVMAWREEIDPSLTAY